MKVTIKKVSEGDRILHSLGNFSSFMDTAREDGLIFCMGLSKQIYIPLSKLRVFLDDWNFSPGETMFDPWEED